MYVYLAVADQVLHSLKIRQGRLACWRSRLRNGLRIKTTIQSSALALGFRDCSCLAPPAWLVCCVLPTVKIGGHDKKMRGMSCILSAVRMRRNCIALCWFSRPVQPTGRRSRPIAAAASAYFLQTEREFRTTTHEPRTTRSSEPFTPRLFVRHIRGRQRIRVSATYI